jgi:hypothetical protein
MEFFPQYPFYDCGRTLNDILIPCPPFSSSARTFFWSRGDNGERKHFWIKFFLIPSFQSGINDLGKNTFPMWTPMKGFLKVFEVITD